MDAMRLGSPAGKDGLSVNAVTMPSMNLQFWRRSSECHHPAKATADAGSYGLSFLQMWSPRKLAPIADGCWPTLAVAIAENL